jgi:putative ABC transport system ATP-binding protein
MPPDEPVVEAIGLSHVHRGQGISVRALDGVSLSVASGEVVAVVGPSGSGKSTLLFLLGGLEEPDHGAVMVDGIDWKSLGNADRARFRRRRCGYVVQGIALLPQATAAENAEVPLLLDGVEPSVRRRRVAEVMDRVGLGAEGTKLPDQLSGGQQQRVAIARALVMGPALILADEPTGNLDSETGRAITQLLVEAAVERHCAVVLVTHDESVASQADRVLQLHSGRLRDDTSGSSEVLT